MFRLLKSFDRLNPNPDEIIIVDDNSTDKTKELLNCWKKNKTNYDKKIFLKPLNKGPADSRNLGIKNSKNNLIAFTDDDVIVQKDWIKYITLKFKKGDSNLVGIGGIVKSVKNDILSQYYTEHKILEAPKNLNYIPTVNSCFRKKPLIEIGGFNTNFSFAGGEDTDLGLRLREKGFFFQKDKRAIVFHDFSKNYIDFCKMWIRYGKGTQLAIINSQERL